MTTPAPQLTPAPSNPGAGGGKRIDPLFVVIGIAAVGVLVAALHHPRSGMYVVCGGLAAGAVARLVLSPRHAGLLVVRRRRFDVFVLAGLAIALGVLAAVTPFPHGTG